VIIKYGFFFCVILAADGDYAVATHPREGRPFTALSRGSLRGGRPRRERYGQEDSSTSHGQRYASRSR
jgi:hypothetical protein